MTFTEIPGAPGHSPIYMWAHPNTVEDAARAQLDNVSTLPWIHHHVAVMPDVHFGKGATVGSVIAMKDAVAPSAVGVDIGCGMVAARTNLTAADLPDSLSALRSAVEAAIPVGFSQHAVPIGNRPGWNISFDDFSLLSAPVQDQLSKAQAQMGTLGGGNHFIELCLDGDDNVWLMLHSGSRGIGNLIASSHIKIAKTLEHNARLPDPDLAVFLSNTPEMTRYLYDLNWAQKYARINRGVMLTLYLQTINEALGPMRIGGRQVTLSERINCHHNYVSEERHFGSEVLVTRKGAISAKAGEMGIIPGSMGTGSYIVRGLGNPDSFNSAPHGAGRRMSRTKARKAFTLADFKAQTLGVESRKDEKLIDEIPGAYKDIETVVGQASDLVEIVEHLTAVMCVKG